MAQRRPPWQRWFLRGLVAAVVAVPALYCLRLYLWDDGAGQLILVAAAIAIGIVVSNVVADARNWD